MNQQLIDYIKNQLKLGRSEDVIKAMLKNNGWQEADIGEGFREISGQNTSLPLPSTDFQPVYPSNRPSFSGNASEIALPGGLDLLKQSWQIYKSRFWTLIGITAIPFLAWLIISGLFLISSFISSSVSGLIFVFTILIFISIIPAIIISFWSGIALFYAVKGNSEMIGLKESFRQVWGKKILSFAWVSLLNSLIVFGGFILGIIPGIIFGIWFIVAQFVFVVEEKKGFNALLRSKEYVSGRWGKIFWRMIVLWIAALIIGLISWGVSFEIGLIYKPASAIISSAINILFGPFVVIYLFSIYTALRQTRPELINQPVVAKKGFFVFCAILGVLAPIVIFVIVILSGVAVLPVS